MRSTNSYETDAWNHWYYQCKSAFTCISRACPLAHRKRVIGSDRCGVLERRNEQHAKSSDFCSEVVLTLENLDIREVIIMGEREKSASSEVVCVDNAASPRSEISCSTFARRGESSTRLEILSFLCKQRSPARQHIV